MSFASQRRAIGDGYSVKAFTQSIATDLGYESANSFVLMFRKVLGISPARYMTQRQAKSPNAVSKEPGLLRPSA